MLLWPTVAVLGFVAMSGLVIALGRSATARYEFERNGVQEQRQRAARATAQEKHDVGGSPASGPGGEPPRQLSRNGSHRRLERAPATAWWPVDGCGDRHGAPVLAGLPTDRIRADRMALSGGLPTAAGAVYEVRRAGGLLLLRQSPREPAWLAELARHWGRLAEDWGGVLTDDALTAFVLAGLARHDRHEHGRLSPHPAGRAAVDAIVEQTVNAVIADVLASALPGQGPQDEGVVRPLSEARTPTLGMLAAAAPLRLCDVR